MSREGLRPIFLVGFMGSGKSAVGRALAEELDWAFEDTDALVMTLAGRDIETIFREDGEGRFRELEWNALRSLAGRTRVVIATGGGLFLGTAQREFIRNEGTSVWLDVPWSVVASRVGSGTGRPLWIHDDAIAARAQFEKRRATYALADLVVTSSQGSPREVAARIANLANARPH